MTLVGGGLALIGVAVSEVFERLRRRDDRAWNERARLYTELAEWSSRVDRALHAFDGPTWPSGTALTAAREELERLDLPPELWVRLRLFGSRVVLEALPSLMGRLRDVPSQLRGSSESSLGVPAAEIGRAHLRLVRESNQRLQRVLSDEVDKNLRPHWPRRGWRA